MKAVHLHIDRIAVEGLDEMGQRQFARTLEEHLHAWAASQAASGIAANAHVQIPSLDAGMLRPGATARQAAAQVVNSLARRLGANGRGGHSPSEQNHRPVNASGKGAQRHV
ncbi:MAG: hypothetical protein WBP85_05430 [Terracidiphilus sp.]